MKRYLVPLALVFLLVPFLLASDSDAPPEGFKPLFNGKDLTGWKTHGGKLESWGAEKGVLYVNGRGGGWRPEAVHL